MENREIAFLSGPGDCLPLELRQHNYTCIVCWLLCMMTMINGWTLIANFRHSTHLIWFKYLHADESQQGNVQSNSSCFFALSSLVDDVLETTVNASLFSGFFPAGLKHIIISPLLKKRNLYPCISENYRQISNCPFLGKHFENVVYQELNHYLSFSN